MKTGSAKEPFASNGLAINIRKIVSLDVFSFIFQCHLPMLMEHRRMRHAVEWTFIVHRALGIPRSKGFGRGHDFPDQQKINANR